MKLKLERPIAFIDLETTGIDISKDRIVEIAILKIRPDGNRDMKVRRVNPTIPIPEEAAAIHGISDEDVKDMPTFQQLAKSMFIFLSDCDLAGFNSNRFDIPLLVEEFLRADIRLDVKDKNMIDVQNIFHKQEKRTLEAAYQFYCQKDLVNAHSAEADIEATYEVLEAQIDKYDDLENDMNFLHEYSKRQNFADLAGRVAYNEQEEEVFNFGKHKGKRLMDVFRQEPSYYSWMMNGDFPLYTKEILKDVWEKVKA